MTSRSIAFLLTVILCAVGARAACPLKAPGILSITFPQCRGDKACPNGLVEIGLRGMAPPSHNSDYYRVQPCDTVEWSFGDGTTQTTTGIETVSHVYPNPGNYVIGAKVTNALGSRQAIQARDPVVIATSPSQLTFDTTTRKFALPGGVEHQCYDCVLLHEDIGMAAIPVFRTLDMSRTVSADVMVSFGNTWIRTPVTFLPGETQKSISVQVPNDETYTGYREAGLRFENAAGGTLTNVVYARLAIIDDDPAPTMSIEPHYEVKEGHRRTTAAKVPVRLSHPMAEVAAATTFCEDGTARSGNDYYCRYDLYIPRGETSGSASLAILGDTQPEADQTFRIRIGPRGMASTEFGTATCLVTILNDDAAFYPARVNLRSGSPRKVTLQLGSPYSVPTTVTFESSSSEIVPPPAPIVVPAGVTKVEVIVTARRSGVASITAVVPDRTLKPLEIAATTSRRRAAGH